MFVWSFWYCLCSGKLKEMLLDVLVVIFGFPVFFWSVWICLVRFIVSDLFGVRSHWPSRFDSEKLWRCSSVQASHGSMGRFLSWEEAALLVWWPTSRLHIAQTVVVWALAEQPGLWRAGACESRWWHLCAWLDKCLACWALKGDSDSVDLHSDVVVGFVSEPAGCLHVQHHRSEITADACGPSWTPGIGAAWKLQQDAYMALCI